MISFKQFLAEGIHDPSIFKVVFLAGGPGSGKSFIVGKTALSSLGFVTINSDIAFENLMRKLGLDFKMPESEAEQRDMAREAAKATMDKKLSLSLQGRLGLVIDGTGRDYDKIEKMSNKFAQLGYDSAMIFVNTDLKTALARNAKRERSVPEKIASDLWHDVQRNIGKFQQKFGNTFFLIDNSDGSNYESQVNTVYKKILSWSKAKPANKIVNQWIKSQKSNLLEYRYKESHREDVEAMKEDGYECAQSGTATRPEQSEEYMKTINKYADVPLHNRVHFKNSWLEGFRKYIKPQNENSDVREAKEMDDDTDPCWDDYEMVGFKKKNGKKVPNCVPKK